MIARINAPLISPLGFQASVIVFAIILLGVLFMAIALRKFFSKRPPVPGDDWTTKSPGSENPSAFMAASMQGVIEKLRTQEKELERLHRLEKERAQESERLTEEVTRNMPTGLLLVNATGAISLANPASETALGFRGLHYRSYREVLGKDSDLATMLSTCLREGQTYQRNEVQHTTPAGEVRQLGVTISPILRTVPAPAQSVTAWATNPIESMPWANTPPIPAAFANSSSWWIGLKSPEAPA